MHALRRLALVGAVAAAAATASATTAAKSPSRSVEDPAGPMTGGWADVPVGDHETALLDEVLADATFYPADDTTRLCFVEIQSIASQVVAGTNYRFTATACTVDSTEIGHGECSSAIADDCSPQPYTIQVFESLHDNAAAIKSIAIAGEDGADEDDDADSTQDGGVMTGDWTDEVVDDDDRAYLTAVLADDEFYAQEVSTRLCFFDIAAVQTQVVAGTNYRYTVNACAVESAQNGGGACTPAQTNCSPSTFTVQIFDQPWTNTTTITAIDETTAAESSEHETVYTIRIHMHNTK